MSEPNRISELDHVCALDLETSGLGEQSDQVLEVAAVFGGFVDGRFVETMRFECVLPIQSNIEDWHEAVLKMHSSSGLLVEAMAARKKDLALTRKLAGPNKCATPTEEVDRRLCSVAPRLSEPAKWTLLGNSVHFDLRFVRRVFPMFAARLSHRVIDVSSVRLFCESLGRPDVKGPVAHRAMADVEASLAEFAACQAWIGCLDMADGPKPPKPKLEPKIEITCDPEPPLKHRDISAAVAYELAKIDLSGAG